MRIVSGYIQSILLAVYFNGKTEDETTEAVKNACTFVYLNHFVQECECSEKSFDTSCMLKDMRRWKVYDCPLNKSFTGGDTCGLYMVRREWSSGAMGGNCAYGYHLDVSDAAGTELSMRGECVNTLLEYEGGTANNVETTIIITAISLSGHIKL